MNSKIIGNEFPVTVVNVKNIFWVAYCGEKEVAKSTNLSDLRVQLRAWFTANSGN